MVAGEMGHFAVVCAFVGCRCREGDVVDHGDPLHLAGRVLSCGFARSVAVAACSFGLRVEGSGVEWSAVAGLRGDLDLEGLPARVDKRTANRWGRGWMADVPRHPYPTPR